MAARTQRSRWQRQCFGAFPACPLGCSMVGAEVPAPLSVLAKMLPQRPFFHRPGGTVLRGSRCCAAPSFRPPAARCPKVPRRLEANQEGSSPASCTHLRPDRVCAGDPCAGPPAPISRLPIARSDHRLLHGAAAPDRARLRRGFPECFDVAPLHLLSRWLAPPGLPHAP